MFNTHFREYPELHEKRLIFHYNCRYLRSYVLKSRQPSAVDIWKTAY